MNHGLVYKQSHALDTATALKIRYLNLPRYFPTLYSITEPNDDSRDVYGV